MTGKLLWRGMLAGLVASLLSFGFLKVAGEPTVDRAIAFEDAMGKAKARADEAAAKGLTGEAEQPEPELVSRSVQASVGLLTGVVVYGTAFGGLFALAFALAFGRIGDFSPRATSALLSLLGFAGIYLIPMLKYPASPPSVGLPETIGMRSSLYFSMVSISLAAMIAACLLRGVLNNRFGDWNAVLIAAGAYLTVVAGVGLALPGVNEVPEAFPASLLWDFRMASLGGQLIMWATLGLLFGVLAERVVGERVPPFRRMLA
jgi:predicted cobalt transporter CbtA